MKLMQVVGLTDLILHAGDRLSIDWVRADELLVQLFMDFDGDMRLIRRFRNYFLDEDGQRIIDDFMEFHDLDEFILTTD